MYLILLVYDMITEARLLQPLIISVFTFSFADCFVNNYVFHSLLFEVQANVAQIFPFSEISPFRADASFASE